MPAFKFTHLFEYLSGAEGAATRRKAGWSESVYWTDALTTTINTFASLGARRANLLPANAAIIGYRVQQVDPVGTAQSGVLSLPGLQSATINRPDIPQMALLLRVRGAGVTNVRSMRLAALPDNIVTDGEYTPYGTYQTAMTAYLSRLSFWKFRGQDLTITRKLLNNITALGVATTDEDIPLVIGDKVRVYNARTASGALVQGVFTVSAALTLRTFTLRGYTLGACTGGQVRKVAYVYPTILASDASISRVVTRKVGRPFTGYVGRQRRRRR